MLLFFQANFRKIDSSALDIVLQEKPRKKRKVQKEGQLRSPSSFTQKFSSITKSLTLAPTGTSEPTVKLQRNHVIARYVGQTAPLTNEVLDRHRGKVILFDEFHGFIHDDHDSFGQEAVNEIITRASTQSRYYCFAFIGHKDRMESIFRCVPGFIRRVHEIEFSPYTSSELAEIFLFHVGKSSWECKLGVKDIESYFADQKLFTNQGGDVEKLLLSCKKVLAEQWIPGKPKEITLEVFKLGYQKLQGAKKKPEENFMYS